MKIWQQAFETIFDQPIQQSIPIPGLGNVFRFRTKTIKSGPVLESEIYPIWNTRSETRSARERVTREAQQNLNRDNAVKKLVRLVNTNFTDRDLAITLTYEGPTPDLHQAQKDIRNYIRRVRDLRRKHGLSEMKYIYVIEGQGPGQKQKPDGDQMALPGIPESGGDKVITRVHHHIILSGAELPDVDTRDVLERLWGKGWANCRRLQPDADSWLEAIARYMVKKRRPHVIRCGAANGAKPEKGFLSGLDGENDHLPGLLKTAAWDLSNMQKRWYSSRNLQQPKVTVSDWKLSRRKVQQAVEQIEDGPGTIFNRAYPGYRLTDVAIFSSKFVSGVYIHARMIKIADPPGIRRNPQKQGRKQNERNRITGCVPALLPAVGI
ncbi:MAG: hypothetical protein AB9907_14805 [Flexilinea sp.]